MALSVRKIEASIATRIHSSVPSVFNSRRLPAYSWRSNKVGESPFPIPNHWPFLMIYANLFLFENLPALNPCNFE